MRGEYYIDIHYPQCNRKTLCTSCFHRHGRCGQEHGRQYSYDSMQEQRRSRLGTERCVLASKIHVLSACEVSSGQEICSFARSAWQKQSPCRVRKRRVLRPSSSSSSPLPCRRSLACPCALPRFDQLFVRHSEVLQTFRTGPGRPVPRVCHRSRGSSCGSVN